MYYSFNDWDLFLPCQNSSVKHLSHVRHPITGRPNESIKQAHCRPRNTHSDLHLASLAVAIELKFKSSQGGSV